MPPAADVMEVTYGGCTEILIANRYTGDIRACAADAYDTSGEMEHYHFSKDDISDLLHDEINGSSDCCCAPGSVLAPKIVSIHHTNSRGCYAAADVDEAISLEDTIDTLDQIDCFEMDLDAEAEAADDMYGGKWWKRLKKALRVVVVIAVAVAVYKAAPYLAPAANTVMRIMCGCAVGGFANMLWDLVEDVVSCSASPHLRAPIPPSPTPIPPIQYNNNGE